MYTQKGFKPYDERTTAQGAMQQEGKAPTKYVDEENQLKQTSEANVVNNSAGFNPAESTVSQATTASKKSEASVKPNLIQAAQASARTMKPPTTVTTPQARMAGGQGGDKKMSQKMFSRFGKQKQDFWSKYKKEKQLNSDMAAKKWQVKGKGDSVMNTKLQAINNVMGVNLHKSA